MQIGRKALDRQIDKQIVIAAAHEKARVPREGAGRTITKSYRYVDRKIYSKKNIRQIDRQIDRQVCRQIDKIVLGAAQKQAGVTREGAGRNITTLEKQIARQVGRKIDRQFSVQLTNKLESPTRPEKAHN